VQTLCIYKTDRLYIMPTNFIFVSKTILNEKSM